MIKLLDVRKTYPIQGSSPVVALDDVNLNVTKGSIHGIVGQSGAGKSTLVRCLTALESPTSGEIFVNGVDMTKLTGSKLRAARRNIGVVFQKPNLLDARTASLNIAYPLQLAGVEKSVTTKRVQELLDVVGLGGRGSSYPSQLSGGQQQRIGIARGMATNPPVLLCDEPTSALDSRSTRQIMTLLTKLRDNMGVTILVITHQMEVVMDICDSVTLLQHGTVVQSGTLRQVLSQTDSQLSQDLVPRPNVDGVQLGPKQTLLDVSFTSSPGIPTGAAVMNLVASMGADVAAGQFESINSLQVGRLVLTVPLFNAEAIRGQLEKAGVLVRSWE